MESVFKAIEQTFGAVMLKVAVVLFLLYFLGEGFSKLVLSVRGFSSGRRRLEREKSLLEVLKLRCDIEAVKKVHGLDHITLPTQDPLDFEPRVKQASAPLARSFTEFLATLGGLGTVLLTILAFVLQVISVFALGVVGLGVIDLWSGQLRGNDIKVVVGAVVMGGIAAYLGFFVVRRRLTLRAPRISLGATIAAVGSAVALVISVLVMVFRAAP